MAGLLGWYAEFLLKIILQFFTWKKKCKIELEDHAKLSAYWPWFGIHNIAVKCLKKSAILFYAMPPIYRTSYVMD